jgi:hypothetical protein
MTDALLTGYVHLVCWWTAPPVRARARGDHGEGVISAAIAVLVMAGIGALMWVGFKAMWQDTESNTKDKVSEIGE